MAAERLDLPGVCPDGPVVSAGRELGHADIARVELDQRQLMHVHDLPRLPSVEWPGERVVELDESQMRACIAPERGDLSTKVAVGRDPGKWLGHLTLAGPVHARVRGQDGPTMRGRRGHRRRMMCPALAPCPAFVP